MKVFDAGICGTFPQWLSPRVGHKVVWVRGRNLTPDAGFLSVLACRFQILSAHRFSPVQDDCSITCSDTLKRLHPSLGADVYDNRRNAFVEAVDAGGYRSLI